MAKQKHKRWIVKQRIDRKTKDMDSKTKAQKMDCKTESRQMERKIKAQTLDRKAYCKHARWIVKEELRRWIVTRGRGFFDKRKRRLFSSTFEGWKSSPKTTSDGMFQEKASSSKTFWTNTPPWMGFYNGIKWTLRRRSIVDFTSCFMRDL